MMSIVSSLENCLNHYFGDYAIFAFKFVISVHYQRLVKQFVILFLTESIFD